MATRRGLVGPRVSVLSSPWYGYDKMLKNEWDPAKALQSATFAFTDEFRTIKRVSGGSYWYSHGAKYAMPTDRKSVVEYYSKPGSSLGSYIGFITTEWTTTDVSASPGSRPGSGAYSPTVGQLGYTGSGTGISKVPALGVKGECVPGDTVAMGLDPFTGSIYLWRNGIPLNSGAPVFSGLQGKIVLPTGCTYSAGSEQTIYSGNKLRYNYPGFSLPAEGIIDACKGSVKLNPLTKPTLSSVFENDYAVYATGAAASYQTGLASKTFDLSSKSSLEFIVQYASNSTEHYLGACFDGDNASMKAGVLGTLANSLGIKVTGGYYVFQGNGCNVAPGLPQKLALTGDVIAFGYDPVAKTMKLWINGTAFNSGNPVWTNVNPNLITAAYSLRMNYACVRLNTDLPRFTYQDYPQIA